MGYLPMRSKIDASVERRTKRKQFKSSPGGKALQRLFFYFGQRDPALTDDVVETLPIAKAALPQFGVTKRAAREKAPTAPRGVRARRSASATKSFATLIIKAATGLTARKRRSRTRHGMARAAAAVPAAAVMWQEIGPSLVSNGQTYGSNRVDVIGRVSAIAVDPNNPKHLLLGAAGGGIWESADTGATWHPRTDQMPSLAIGATSLVMTRTG